jgi:hypothetical protein
MTETGENLQSHEQARNFFRGLLKPLDTPIQPEDFVRNNFFNNAGRDITGKIHSGIFHIDTMKNLGQNTPKTVLLAQLVGTAPLAPDKQALYKYAEAHFDNYHMLLADWQSQGKTAGELTAIRNKIPPDAGIRQIFTAASEFFDAKYGPQFDVLLEETAEFGWFVALSNDPPDYDGEVVNLNQSQAAS